MLPVIPKNEITLVRRFAPRMYMNAGEIDILVALFYSVSPKVVVEFGVNIGMTAQALLDNINCIENYVGIDVSPGYTCSIPGQQKEVPVNPGWLVQDDERFKLILRTRGSFDLSSRALPRADAIFIDGDHGYEAVMNDSELAHEIINEGGIIVWHDYGNNTVEVTQALDDLAMHDHRQIFNIAGTWLAVERF